MGHIMANNDLVMHFMQHNIFSDKSKRTKSIRELRIDNLEAVLKKVMDSLAEREELLAKKEASLKKREALLSKREALLASSKDKDGLGPARFLDKDGNEISFLEFMQQSPLYGSDIEFGRD